MHGGAGGLAVDLDHVVLPLDAPCAPVVHAGMLHVVLTDAGVVVIGRRLTLRACREQFHAAVTRLMADYLGMHRACVGGHASPAPISAAPHISTGERLVGFGGPRDPPNWSPIRSGSYFLWRPELAHS